MTMRNKTILYLGVMFAILNLLIGLLISSYDGFNLAITTAIIIITTVFLMIVNGGWGLKEGYKVSLDFIIPTIGLIQYFFALFMPIGFKDNWCLIVILILLVFEPILLISMKKTSNKIK